MYSRKVFLENIYALGLVVVLSLQVFFKILLTVAWLTLNSFANSLQVQKGVFECLWGVLNVNVVSM